MGPLFMAAAVACRSLNNCVLNTVAKTRIKSRSGHYLFATIASAVAMLFVIAVSGGIPEIEDADILHGIILGFLSIGEEFFLLSALECGSMAMTMICAFMAFGLTHVVSVPVFGSSLDVLDVAGVILAVVCVLVLMLDSINTKNLGAHDKKEFSHWRKFVLILIVLTSLVEIEEKLHSTAAASGSHMGYYFVAFLTATIFAGILFLIRNKGKNEATQFKYDAKFILMLLFCGIMKALIYIVVGLAAAEIKEELVTIINSSAVILILVLLDRFYFKSKFIWNNYLAAVLAIAAIVCMR